MPKRDVFSSCAVNEMQKPYRNGRVCIIDQRGWHSGSWQPAVLCIIRIVLYGVLIRMVYCWTLVRNLETVLLFLLFEAAIASL